MNIHDSNTTSDGLNQKSVFPILRFGSTLNDNDLRERLKSQWEFSMVTAAFIAAIAVTFVSVDQPPRTQNDILWEPFMVMSASAFIMLVVSVIFFIQFLTTLLMTPHDKAHLALAKLRYVEPIPSWWWLSCSLEHVPQF